MEKPVQPNDDHIETLRTNVDGIDGDILNLLAERRRLSMEIAVEKQKAANSSLLGCTERVANHRT